MSDPASAIGRTTVSHDVVAAQSLGRLSALLDHDTPPWAATEMPPLGHWLNFLPDARQSLIGMDGHPLRGDFLPAVPDLPRRMWAGSRIVFEHPISIGADIQRTSTITHVERKEGRTGSLMFVTIRHDVSVGGIVAIVEDQDIVYRAAAPVSMSPPPAIAATKDVAVGAFRRQVTPSEAMLFRYSALTFNAHRIHYDRDYARECEGYTDLVVHGPLTATLLMDLFLRHHPGALVRRFAFVGKRPLLLGAPFTLHGTVNGAVADLWATDSDGHMCMSASVETA
jgi:3-methylfumaryl-CoA hydratase